MTVADHEPRNTCRGCAHWEPMNFAKVDDPEGEKWVRFADGHVLTEDEEYSEPIYDSNVKLDAGTEAVPWGHCTKVDELSASPTAKFYVQDGSDYRADLYTRHDFGCVEWERK